MHVHDIKPNLMVHARIVEAAAAARGGVHVGTVDHVEAGRFIKLKKSDSADGRHHWIPLDWVEDVDDKAVYLNRTTEEFAREVLDVNPLYIL